MNDFDSPVTSITRDFLARAIRQGRGQEPADLVLHGGRIFDLVTGALTEGDVAICGDRIVGTGGRYEGLRVIEARGRVVVPGFVDTHFHCESSLLTPLEYDRCVVRHGVTTAIWDPHEIANVLGREGIAYALRAAEATILDLRVMLSSCVPASPLETSGAALAVGDLLPFAQHPKALGLAEMMNFPGVLAGDDGCLAKLAAFAGRPIDGHAPLLRGRDLDGYLAAGIRTDHETTGLAEAREKLSKGMTLLIREGSVSKDLHALAPILDVTTSPFCSLCTDDRNPLDIAEEGHLDFMVRTLISRGVPVLAAYRAASWSGARAYRLPDRGLVAPGWRADLLLIDDLATCNVEAVIAAGRLVENALFAARPTLAAAGRNSVRLPAFTPGDLRVPGQSGLASVIGIVPGRIITEHRRLPVSAEGGYVTADLVGDVLPLAVIERHGKNGNIGRGLVQGFGLQRGAIASSVGHDSHNVTVVGVDAADMALAARRVAEMEGGFVVASGGKVHAELALPVAGLMSLDPFEAVRDRLVHLRAAARELGCTLPEPFLQVAFLALSVIPHLKLTDRGLVDVDRFELMG